MDGKGWDFGGINTLMLDLAISHARIIIPPLVEHEET